MRSAASKILADVLEAMQNADEIGGPQGTDYLDLMAAISREAQERYDTATALISRDRKELERRIKDHDWYYNYSDDAGAYYKGRSNHDAILDLIRRVPGGQELYDQHRK
jgi:hypothetical protein